MPFLTQGEPGLQGYQTEDSDIYMRSICLDRILDVGEVQSLLFVKNYPQGEDGFKEENFYVVPLN